MNTFENELLTCCLKHHIIKKEEKYVEIRGEFLFPSTFTGFQGHFPARPILPAVIQLITIRLVAEQTLTRDLFPSQYGKTKFRLIIEPEQPVIVELKLDISDKSVDCKFQLKQQDGKLFSDGNCRFIFC